MSVWNGTMFYSCMISNNVNDNNTEKVYSYSIYRHKKLQPVYKEKSQSYSIYIMQTLCICATFIKIKKSLKQLNKVISKRVILQL